MSSIMKFAGEPKVISGGNGGSPIKRIEKQRDRMRREQNLILAAMQSGFSHNCLIEKHLELPHSRVTAMMLKLEKAGQIERYMRGGYKLKPNVIVPEVVIEKEQTWADKMKSYFTFKLPAIGTD